MRLYRSLLSSLLFFISAGRLIGADISDYEDSYAVDQTSESSAQAAGSSESFFDRWAIKAGVAVLGRPEAYFGSDNNYVLSVFPYFSATYDDKFFIDVDEGLGVKFVNYNDSTAALQLSAAVGYRFGQTTKDSSVYHPFDYKGTVETRLAAEGRFSFLLFDSQLAYGLSGGNKGFNFDAYLAPLRFALLDNRLLVSSGLFVKGGDQAYLQTRYGVSEEQSLESGLAETKVNGGLERYGVGVKTILSLTEKVEMKTYVELGRLANSLDSPRITRRNSLHFGSIIAYSF